MPVSSPLSTPGVDYCVDLALGLRAIGATESETQAYIQGVRNDGALVFANGSSEQVETFAEIMNRHQAACVEELTVMEPDLTEMPHDSAFPRNADTAQAGRVRCAGGGARMFAW